MKRVREILASPPAASALNNDNHEDKQQQQLPNVTGDVSSERPDMDCYSAHRQVLIWLIEGDCNGNARFKGQN